MVVRGTLEDDGISLRGQVFDLRSAPNSSSSFLCCLPDFDNGSKSSNFISYKNILWVDEAVNSDSEDPMNSEFLNVEVTFLKENSNSSKGGKLIPNCMNIIFDKLPSTGSSGDETNNLTSLLMSKAYSNSEPQKRVLVLANPHGGQGKAIKIYKEEVLPVFKAAHYNIELVETKYYGHAVDIAREIDLEKYDVLVCASGDGIPHEVMNGLYQRPDRVKAFNKLVITQAPCGSGNAMSLSFHKTLDPSTAALEIVKGHVVKTDVMAVTNALDDPVKLSFLSSTYGIIAEADIGTEWMRSVGSIRFELGVAGQVFSGAKYPCSIAVKYVTRTKEELNQFYLTESKKKSKATELTEESFNLKYHRPGDDFTKEDLSDYPGWEWLDQGLCDNLGIFYAGKIPYISKDTNFFPATLPQDGTFDIVVTDTRTGVLKTAEILMSLDKGKHVWYDEVQHAKVEAIRLIPKLPHGKKSYISIDGENFPFVPFQVEIMHGILKTIMSDGTFIETGFKDKVLASLNMNMNRGDEDGNSTTGLL